MYNTDIPISGCVSGIHVLGCMAMRMSKSEGVCLGGGGEDIRTNLLSACLSLYWSLYRPILPWRIGLCNSGGV